jgi:outer membrane protein assembly factor BamB
VNTFVDWNLRVPAVDNGILYANILQRLTASDAATLAPLWVWGKQDRQASPAVANGVVVFYDGLNQRLTALHGSPPAVLWSVSMQSAFSPILSGGLVYVGSGDKTFYCLDAATGAVQWKLLTTAPFTALQIPAISGSLIYVPGADGILYVLDKLTGAEVWRHTGSAAWGPVVIGGGRIYACDWTETCTAFAPAPANPLPAGSITFDASSTSLRYENAIPAPWQHTMKSCANGFLIVGVGQATGHNITSVAFDGVAFAPVPAGF